MRSLPLAAEHEAAGATFGDVADWRLPLDYGDPMGEQRTIRAGAGVIDLSAKGKVRVTGPDRLSFLDGLLTNDLKTLESGRGLWAATLDHKGRVHGDMAVHHLGDSYVLATEAEAGGAVLAHMNRLLVSDDVTMADVTDEFGVLGIFGPRSGGVAAKVLGASPPTEAYASVEMGGLRVVRSPAFGGEGYEVWVPRDRARTVWRELRAGDARPCGHRAAEALRIEAGRPKYPVDMNEETIVLEAGLASAISMTKGCYVGQEVVSRATYIGHVNRWLVGLTVDSDSPPTAGAVVVADGKPVGHVTSAAKSEGLGVVVALGYVRREHAEPGRRVAVRDGREWPARVSRLPFAVP